MTGKGQVLIIEDDTLFAALMTETLQQDGIACIVATTLPAALRLLSAQDFDVIITDIHVPGTDDMPVLDMLAQQFDAGTPIIVITGLPSLESAMQSMDRRAFTYRTKPLVMADLLTSVRDALHESQVRRRLRSTRARLRELDAQLDELRKMTRSPQEAGLDQSLSEYILLLLGNCGDNLAEAVEAFRLMDKSALNKPVRQLSRHPEAEMFRRAIEQTVQVLERTRHSFKSRELADLRQQLEAALAVARRE